MSAHMFLSDCCSTSPLIFKSKSKVGFQLYLAKERQHSHYVSRKDISISSREVSVRSQNLHRTDMSTPVTGKGAVSVRTLLDFIGTDSLKELQYLGLCVRVCFSPLQLEITLFKIRYF